MTFKIVHRVATRYRSYVDQDIAQGMWDDMVSELPKGLQLLFRKPEEQHTRDKHTLEKQVDLDGNEVSIYLQAQYSSEDDADEGGIYAVDHKGVEFGFLAHPLYLNGKDDEDLKKFKAQLHTWVGKVRKSYPQVAEEYGIRSFDSLTCSASMGNRNKTIYLRHSGGGTHALRGKNLAKLLSELKAGRGMPEIMKLIESGYSETLGGIDLSGENLYQPLQDEADGKLLGS